MYKSFKGLQQARDFCQHLMTNNKRRLWRNNSSHKIQISGQYLNLQYEFYILYRSLHKSRSKRNIWRIKDKLWGSRSLWALVERRGSSSGEGAVPRRTSHWCWTLENFSIHPSVSSELKKRQEVGGHAAWVNFLCSFKLHQLYRSISCSFQKEKVYIFNFCPSL